jgi:hypothetical protein
MSAINFYSGKISTAEKLGRATGRRGLSGEGKGVVAAGGTQWAGKAEGWMVRSEKRGPN